MYNLLEPLPKSHHSYSVSGSIDTCVPRIGTQGCLCRSAPHGIRTCFCRSWADGDFSSMLDWLLLQCGRPQTECRHSAMDLVYKLATSLPGLNSPVTLWVDNNICDCVDCHKYAYNCCFECICRLLILVVFTAIMKAFSWSMFSSSLPL